MKKLVLVPLSLTLIAGISGCSMNRFAARTTIGVMEPAARAFYEEGDLEFAREAMPGSLKLMEGLLQSDPENEDLLTLLAQGFCSYSFAFLEESERPGNLERARSFYQRGYQYGLRALPEKVRAYASGDLEEFSRAVSGVEDVAPLFWTAYCLGSWVNVNKSDVGAVAELTRVEAMMKRSLELDEKFYNGSAHAFYGVYYGGRPKMLGGSPEKAKTHLERAMALTGGKFLIPKVYFAQFYAVPTQDEALFEKTLKEVIEAPADLMPSERLANVVAQKKARKLLGQKKDLF